MMAKLVKAMRWPSTRGVTSLVSAKSHDEGYRVHHRRRLHALVAQAEIQDAHYDEDQIGDDAADGRDGAGETKIAPNRTDLPRESLP